jgi:hypothetical protein
LADKRIRELTEKASIVATDQIVVDSDALPEAKRVSFATISALFAWGNILGTLSDQTDLQNELDAKLPTTDPAFVAYREGVVTATAGATYTIDWTAGTIFALTLTDNTAVTMSNVAAGRSITVIYIQDGVGGRIPTYVNTIRWPGSAPVLSTAASARDKLVFDSYNGTVIDGQLAGKAYA